MAGTANSGGRNRKPASQHRLEGTYQKVRHEGQGAPEPPKGEPKKPKLKGEASAEWDRMVSRLTQSRTLSKVDDAALYQYVKLHAETEQISVAHEHTSGLIEKIEGRLPDLTDSDLSDAIRNLVQLKQLEARYSTQVRQGRMAVRQYLVEFGMTPAARTRVKVAEAPETSDPFSEFDEHAKAH